MENTLKNLAQMTEPQLDQILKECERDMDEETATAVMEERQRRATSPATLAKPGAQTTVTPEEYAVLQKQFGTGHHNDFKGALAGARGKIIIPTPAPEVIVTPPPAKIIIPPPAPKKILTPNKPPSILRGEKGKPV